MKVVVFTCDQPNQWELCHRLQPVCDLAGIVISSNMPRKTPTIRNRTYGLFNRVASRTVGRSFVTAWQHLQADSRARYRGFPSVPQVQVQNINDPTTVDFVQQHRPGLVLVSGTNLLSDRTIRAIQEIAPVINLHTGISPFVKGGPNCTNWCLTLNRLELIGNTVMWLDAGIDSGDIITTEQTPLSGHESLSELHRKVMDHAHSLVTRVVKRLDQNEPVPRISQLSLGEGSTFFNRDWTAPSMLRAIRNFKHFASELPRQRRERSVKLVPLE
jgi:folate-dependent phosphoribosylglycinamide formyltransferase PurN